MRALRCRMRYNDSEMEIITKKREEYDPETDMNIPSEDKVLIAPVHVMDLGTTASRKFLVNINEVQKWFISNAIKNRIQFISFIEKNAINAWADKQSGRVFYLEKDKLHWVVYLNKKVFDKLKLNFKEWLRWKK